MKQRKPNRLQGYDYSSDNLYFVTSCVHDMICCFGEISAPRMVLNDYGKIAEKQWYWLGEQYPYIILHAFVVMPNHIHGIIEINRGQIVRTGRDLSIQQNDLSLQGNIPIKIKSLSELMGAYKTTVSKQIHLLDGIRTDRSRPVRTEFAWHRSFHEHIIRNEKSFEKISDYIANNTINWKQDKFYNL